MLKCNERNSINIFLQLYTNYDEIKYYIFLIPDLQIGTILLEFLVTLVLLLFNLLCYRNM